MSQMLARHSKRNLLIFIGIIVVLAGIVMFL